MAKVNLSFILLLGLHLFSMESQAIENPRAIREYIAYSFPFDIRETYLLPDVTVANAISSRLVRTNEDGELTADIADRWIVNAKARAIDFHIRSNARWSDGTQITARAVVESMNEGRDRGHSALPGAFKTFVKFELLDPTTVRFHLAPGVQAKLELVSQLTDTTCAIVKLVDGKPSNRVTSGAYYIEQASQKELLMKVNRHWHRYDPEMIEEIRLRRPATGVSVDTLLNDSWPNIVRFGCGVLKSDLAKLPQDIAKHQLNHNRIFGFHYGQRNDLRSTQKLIAFLRGQLDTKAFADLIDDGLPAAQFSPPGLALHSTKTPKVKSIGEREFLRAWKSANVRIAYYQDNLPSGIKLAIENELKRVLPIPFELIGVRASAQIQAEHTKEYDLIFGTLGTDVTDVIGAMSYWIDTDPAHFPSESSGKFNFKARLEALRKNKDNAIDGYRSIVFDVVENNFYLPLAFYSSEVVGRPGFDFSGLSKFSELLPYPAVRLK